MSQNAPFVRTPQEERIEQGNSFTLTMDGAIEVRPRIAAMLEYIRTQKPRIAVDRARLITGSFKTTEPLPIVLLWAKVLEQVIDNIPIHIGDHDLIVGRVGPPGRYGILYPELRGAWLERGLNSLKERKEGAFGFTPEDAKIIRQKILPYWKGRTLFEAHYELLPENTRDLMYEPDDPYTPRYVVIDQSTDRTSLQWVLGYQKVLNRGFLSVRKQAEKRLASLDAFQPGNGFDKTAFLRSIIIICNAMVTYAKRHADLAREMAAEAGDETRRQELLEVADTCDRVPAKPARTFKEAIQTQWFTQVVSRMEQFHGGTVGNGRIDQYLIMKKTRQRAVLMKPRRWNYWSTFGSTCPRTSPSANPALWPTLKWCHILKQPPLEGLTGKVWTQPTSYLT